MLVVTGEFVVHADDIEAFRDATITMMHATEQEDGCLCYRFYADVGKPDHFRVYEEWTDRESLEAHFVVPHMGVFRAALSKLRVLSRAVKTIEGGQHKPLE